MNKVRRHIVFLLLLAVATTVSGQTAVGRDFWVTCFGSYVGDNYHDHVPSLVVMAHEASTVSIANPLTGWTTTLELAAGANESVEVPYEQVLCTTHRQVVPRALHVTSTGNIGLWYAERTDGSNDMALILPTQRLGCRYLYQDYPGLHNDPALAVAAVEDSTVLTFTLPPGVSVPGINTSVFTLTLNAGESCMLGQERGGSFSGTLVTGNHPFFLMQGNLSACVPYDGMPFDCIFDQAVPIEYWGRHFALMPTVRQADGDRVRVTSSADGCVLRLDGQQVAVIEERESYELFLPRDTARRLDASKPVQVLLYLSSTSHGGEVGDPSVVTVVPLEQGVEDFFFREPFASPIYETESRYVNFAVRTADVPYITFDGASVDTFFHPIDSTFSYARIPIDSAAHHIVDPVGTLVGHFYWMGFRRSEAAPCDMGLHLLDRQRLLTDGEERLQYAICQGTTVHFLVGGATSVSWTVDSLPLALTATEMDYTFDSAGIFVVAAVLQDAFDTTLHDTLRVTLVVHPTAATEVYDSICFDASYPWQGRTLEVGGIYVDTLATAVGGCDSVVTLALYQFEKPPIDLLVDIDCEHFSYSLSLLGAPAGIYWSAAPADSALVGHETDSILYPDPQRPTCYTAHIGGRCPFSESVTLQPVTLPQAQVRVEPDCLTYDDSELTVCDITPGGQQRSWWVDGKPVGDGEGCLHLDGIDTREDSVVVTLVVFNGTCYDTLTLVVPILHITLWAPNVITPNAEENRRFELIGTGVDEGELDIYDRQGRLLYHADDYRQGWDGTYKGRPVPQGAYVWRLHYRTAWSPMQWFLRVGTVTIIR